MIVTVSKFAINIVDKSGEVIISSDPIEKEMENVIRHTDANNIPTKGKVVEERWAQEKYIATDSPITINDKHKGHVFMFADTNNVKKVVNHISDQFIISGLIDRKSTRLNSSHVSISYAVFCLKKKKE